MPEQPRGETVTWTAICQLDHLLPERGAAALLGDTQVAVFRLHDNQLYAIGNGDPLSGAQVLSRGIVGTRGDVPVVLSPMHKQAFDLRTGACLDVPGVTVPVYPARCRDGLIEVAVP
ncbi:nitrite reductase small subunit NirD [Longispora fulva]|uniref:nitrite reductase small subunit NirD n=1 Tax=Longispora fulva TaxID=619741 RepID=UPI0018C97F53|nr:nitrite reductase small subunit NirD [Longispora fulva]